MIKIILADDHQIVRQGLKAILEAEKDFSVIGEAGDGHETIQLVEKDIPDVLIVDVMMPEMNGLEVTRQINKRFPEIKIVVLSMRSVEAYVREAFRNGAAGYVIKTSSAQDLVDAVRTVISGRNYLSPLLTEKAVDAYISSARNAPTDVFETLTTREREILQLAAEGMSNTEIAERLMISPHTAMTHRNNLMRKLDLHSQTELVLFAIRRGIISEEF